MQQSWSQEDAKYALIEHMALTTKCLLEHKQAQAQELQVQELS
jgi:hypothetical protein